MHRILATQMLDTMELMVQFENRNGNVANFSKIKRFQMKKKPEEWKCIAHYERLEMFGWKCVCVCETANWPVGQWQYKTIELNFKMGLVSLLLLST